MTSQQPHAGGAGVWRIGGGPAVRRLGFGTMRLTGTEPFHAGVPRERRQSVAVLRRAVELGVNHIDTAAFYFSRLLSANELVNSALAPYPDDLVIATKIGPARDAAGGWADWAEPAQVRGQVEENLRQLGRDHLDLVYLRMNGKRPLAGLFAELARLRTEGLVRHVGLSNITPAQLTEALGIAPVAAVQNRYSLDSRRDGSDDLLELCRERGIAFVPFFAMAGRGAEAGPGGAEPAAVTAVATRHGVTPAQVRLAWTLHRGPHVLAIPGTGDPEHLEQNVAAGALRLTAEDLAELETVPHG